MPHFCALTDLKDFAASCYRARYMAVFFSLSFRLFDFTATIAKLRLRRRGKNEWEIGEVIWAFAPAGSVITRVKFDPKF